FPPKSKDKKQLQQLIYNFCQDQGEEMINETGCAVCGVLYPTIYMKPIAEYVMFMDLLGGTSKNVTRKERIVPSEPIEPVTGPVLAHDCTHVCPECGNTLQTGQIPRNALANGLWIGKVPDALKNLTLAEQLMIAKVRHNRCVVRVAAGGLKMRANAIMFANPTPKIYDT
ncbi:hypothetical protein OE88DRAFT_1613320, partial [Heliocybe sulcata]